MLLWSALQRFHYLLPSWPDSCESFISRTGEKFPRERRLSIHQMRLSRRASPHPAPKRPGDLSITPRLPVLGLGSVLFQLFLCQTAYQLRSFCRGSVDVMLVDCPSYPCLLWLLIWCGQFLSSHHFWKTIRSRYIFLFDISEGLPSCLKFQDFYPFLYTSKPTLRHMDYFRLSLWCVSLSKYLCVRLISFHLVC